MEETIEAAVAEAAERWIYMEGVVGVAQGKQGDRDCIVVMVAERTPAVREGIPRQFWGFAVRIEETGEFHAL